MTDAFAIAIRVYYQDTDAGGVVFHGRYLDFFERARTEWLRRLGFDQTDLLRQHGMLFIVRALEVTYLRPAVLDDMLMVSAGIRRMGRAQITLDQEVVRGSEPLVRGSVNLACVSAGELRPVPLPETVHRVLSTSAARDGTCREPATSGGS
jgi:acyl-CoA thioester hydrolase